MVQQLPTAPFWDKNHSSHAVARRVKVGFKGATSSSHGNAIKWLVWNVFKTLRDEKSLSVAHQLVRGYMICNPTSPLTFPQFCVNLFLFTHIKDFSRMHAHAHGWRPAHACNRSSSANSAIKPECAASEHVECFANEGYGSGMSTYLVGKLCILFTCMITPYFIYDESHAYPRIYSSP